MKALTTDIERGGTGLSAEQDPVGTQRVYLIRHGEIAWNGSGRHTGSTDLPLTANGQQVARRLESQLATETFALVLTSPLSRARTTCELAGLGERAKIDRDLMEWDYGDYEGLTPTEIRELAPNWLIFRDGCPGGESPELVGARADRVIARIRRLEGHVAVFAHDHIISVFAARWLGFSTRCGCHFLLDAGTLCILSYYRGIPAVKRWNCVVPAGSRGDLAGWQTKDEPHDDHRPRRDGGAGRRVRRWDDRRIPAVPPRPSLVGR
jgi:broad specificity phosphatase PhoE